MTDILTKIREDHDRQRELASRILDTSGATDERARLFHDLAVELRAHAAAEERAFYSALMETADGRGQASHSVKEHEEARGILEDLEDMDQSSPGWLQRFRTLAEENEHHMSEEEDEVFALARGVLGDEALEALAVDFARTRADERTRLAHG